MAKTHNAKYCLSCREQVIVERDEVYKQRAIEKGFLVECESCHLLKPAGFATARICLNCYYQSEGRYKKELESRLPEGYRLLKLDGKFVIVNVVAQNGDVRKLFEEIEIAGLLIP